VPTMSKRTCLVTSLLLAAVPAFAQTPAPQPAPPAPAATTPEPTPAPAPTPAPEAAPTLPVPPPEKKPETPAVVSKWDATLYGFVELDTIWDSTQGLNDLAGNAGIPRPGTYAGEHSQTTMAARNSRIGFRLAMPAYNDIKVTGLLEMDFLGNQPPGIAEAAFILNPTFRFRHYNFKLETPIVDILIGQSWQLFGWQPLFHPNTVDIQGVPGQVYSRSPEVRVTKRIKTDDVTVEIAVAAARPPQRASATPDGHAGIKLSYDKRKAYHTGGGAGGALDSAAIGVSVVGRRFAVNEFSATPQTEVTRNGYGLSLDALIPVIPATKDHKENALTLTGDFATGAGIADLYTGLTGGVSQPALPNPMMTNPAPVYTPNVDNGLVMFVEDGTLHPVQWTSFMVGAQYYLPPSGRVFVSANYSHMSSSNAHAFGPSNRVWDKSNWLDTNLFCDVTPAVRLGVTFDWFNQTYVDGTDATNYRAQFSGWLIF
jgi:hypothetical protein